MDSMTGAEFRTYVLSVFKRTDKDTELYEAITDTLIDMRIRFPFEEFACEAYTGGITTLGEYKLDIPTDLGLFVANVRIHDGDDSYPLIRLNKAQFDRKFSNPNYADVDTDMPKYYCVYAKQILLGHVPDSVDYQYEVNYSEEPADEITASTTSVPFTDIYREVLRMGVLYRLFVMLGNDEEATKWKLLYEEELTRLIDRDKRNTESVSKVQYTDV